MKTQLKKLNNLRKLFGVFKFNVEKTVTNLSDIKLSDDEINVLKFGPKHGIRYRINDVSFKAKVESYFGFLSFSQSYKNLIDLGTLKHALLTNSIEYLNKNKKQNINDFLILKNLSNKPIKVCKFDKGNGFVILNNSDYFSKLEKVVEGSQFKKITVVRKNGKCPPQKDEEYLNSLLLKLVANKHLSGDVAKELKSKGAQPAKLYGLPKVHKADIPMRPVLSMIGSAQYGTAKFLDSLLKPLLSKKFECSDSFDFVNFITKQPVEESDFMVSFDVSSLFTNVPLNETIDICCQLWRDNRPASSIIDEIAFRDLLKFSSANVPFLFNDNWYQQVDGVAMGSPLAPTLASIFLSTLEDKMSDYSFAKPKVYKRYVDDIFLVFSNKNEVAPFLNFMNGLHPNILFTIEEEINSCLPFLDLLVEKTNKGFETEIYRKATDTGLYTSPNSFCDFKYNRNMIKGLIHRSWSLSSSFVKADKSIRKLFILLNKNGYSKFLLDRLAKETIDKLVNVPLEKVDVPEVKSKISGAHVFVVPYSEGFKSFRNSVMKALGNSVHFRIVSKSKKSIDMFSNKSRTPFGLASDLVYKFTCNGCNATYIGETSRHLCTRVQEHSRKKGSSHIIEHRKVCKADTNISDFKILHKNFGSYWERILCEALVIKDQSPSINIQSSTNLLRVFI